MHGKVQEGASKRTSAFVSGRFEAGSTALLTWRRSFQCRSWIEAPFQTLRFCLMTWSTGLAH